MNETNILINIISLLTKEAFLKGEVGFSSEFCASILDSIESKKKFVIVGGETDTVQSLKAIATTLLTIDYERGMDIEIILQDIKLVLKDDEYTLQIALDSIIFINDEDKIKTKINNLKNSLQTYFTDTRLSKLLSKASFDFNKKRGMITSLKNFSESLIAEISEIASSDSKVDSAITSEVDFDKEEELDELVKKSKEDNNFGGKYKTGWQGLDEMTSGGIRGGEFCTFMALQHKYKTGVTLSVFMQLMMNNTPVLLDPKRKPLFVWVSMEDDSTLAIKFMYEYLKNCLDEPADDYETKSTSEITKFILNELTKTGFSIKILRVNPTDWSFTGLFGKMLQYEKDGYEIQTVGLDYLSLIPTTGCNNTGPMGTDLRDLFRRTRNFFSVRKTRVLTPHQASAASKQLIRNGVPDLDFVKEVAGKGYYSGSTQLDQEIDLEFYVHLANVGGKTYLTIQRGKHRGAPIIEDKYKYMILPFNNNLPIPSDVGKKKLHTRTIMGAGEDAFDF